MKTTATTYRCEILVRGKWIVASRRWSAVERDAALRTYGGRTDIRFVVEAVFGS